MTKKEFEEFISIGDTIRIVSNGEITIGMVETTSDTVIKLIRADSGKPKLISYEKIDDIDFETENVKVFAPAAAVVEPEPAMEWSELSEAREVIKNIEIPVNSCREMIKQELKANKEIGSRWSSIDASFNDAKKNHTMKEKGEALIAKAGQLMKDYPDCRVLKLFLADIYFDTGNYADALRLYEEGAAYSNAVGCAQRLEEKETILKLSAAYLLAEKADGNDIKADGIVADHIITVFFFYAAELRQGQLTADMIGRMKPECREIHRKTICLGLLYLLDRYQIKVTSISGLEFATEEALEYLTEAVKKHTAGERTIRIPLLPSPAEENKSGKEAEMTGKITFFHKVKRWGYIDGKVYFYIKQVQDEELREWLLYHDFFTKLSVSYTLGTGQNGVAADHIKPLEKPPAKAEKEVIPETSEVWEGFVSEYNKIGKWGIVTGQNSQTYRFNLSAVIDPYLEAYFEQEISIKEVDVLFTLGTHNGKKVINSIYLNPEDSTEEFAQYESYVTTQAAKKWDNYLKNPLPEPIKDKIVKKDIPAYIELIPWVPPLPQAAEHPGNNGYAKPEEKILAQQRDFNNEKNPFLTLEAWTGKEKNPCQKGLDYLLNDKDLDKAEEYFIYALRANDRLETAVTNLIQIYMRRGDQVTKGLQLLEAYKYLFDNEKAADLRIQLLDKGDMYDVLLEELKRSISRTFKANKKLHYILQLATALGKQKHYDEAIYYFNEWKKVKENSEPQLGIKHGSGTKYAIAEEYADRGLAINYYLKGDKKTAKEIAARLLQVKAEDVVATSIMNETFTISGSEDNQTINLSMDLSGDIFDDNDKLQRYADYYIDKVQLSTMARGKKMSARISNNVYFGTPREAGQDIQEYIEQHIKKMTALYKSDAWAFLAKVALQVQKAHPDEGEAFEKYSISQSSVKIYAGRSMVSMGEYVLQKQTGENDTARFFFNQALNMLPEDQNDVTNSFARIISTYFLAQSELINTAHGDKPVYLEYIRAKSCFSVKDLLITTFYLPISVQARTNQVIKEIYHSDLKEHAVEIMKLMAPNEVGEINSIYDFENCWKNAKEGYMEFLNGIEREIYQAARETQMQDKLSGHIIKLRAYLSQNLLFNTDESRLTLFVNDILDKLEKNLKKDDFEQREEDYTNVIDRCNRMSEQIYAAPTELTFETLLDAIEIIKTVVEERLNQLYKDYAPDITLSLASNMAYLKRDNQVGISINISNRHNVQTADGINVLVRGYQNNVNLFKKETTILAVKGGATEEQICTMQLTEVEMAQRFFDIEVEVTYRYLASIGEENEVTKSRIFSINLYDSKDFKEIQNKFMAYSLGGAVEDESMFFGRKDDINEILDMLKLDNGNMLRNRGIVMYGQRRAGKSSIMAHLKDRIKSRYQDSYIIVNMESMGDSQNLRGFLSTILSKTEKALSEEYPEVYQQFLDKNIDFMYEKLEQDPENYMTIFKRSFSAITQELKNIGGDNKYILMLFIDEFTYVYEWIKSGKMDSDFMKFWKALMQSYGICSVVIGQDNMPNFINDYKNEFNCMLKKQISFLEKKDAQELISLPISLEDQTSRFQQAALDFIYDLTAGSAFLIMVFCDVLVKYLNDTYTMYVSKTLIADIFLKQHFMNKREYVNDQLFEAQIQDTSKIGEESRITEEDNKILLAYIAANSTTNYKMLITNIRCYEQLSTKTPEYQKQLFNQLDRRDVIVCEGEYCGIKIDLLRRWLLKESGKEY